MTTHQQRFDDISPEDYAEDKCLGCEKHRERFVELICSLRTLVKHTKSFTGDGVKHLREYVVAYIETAVDDR